VGLLGFAEALAASIEQRSEDRLALKQQEMTTESETALSYWNVTGLTV